MYQPNTASQNGNHRFFRADGQLAGTSPQLVLPQGYSRATLIVQNIGAHSMWLEMGCARATATISGGAVTSITMTNKGFGFTRPPIVSFHGGAGQFVISTVSGWNGIGLQGSQGPHGADLLTTPASYFRAAKGTAVLVNGVVNSITITNPGAGYVNPPEIVLTNDPNDPFGCADPSTNSGSGILLSATGGAYSFSGVACPTDAVALFGTTNDFFTCGYML